MTETQKTCRSLQQDFERFHPLAVRQYIHQVVQGLRVLHEVLNGIWLALFLSYTNVLICVLCLFIKGGISCGGVSVTRSYCIRSESGYISNNYLHEAFAFFTYRMWRKHREDSSLVSVYANNKDASITKVRWFWM